MEKAYIWLILGELLVIGLVIAIKIICDKKEDKKVDKILNYFDKRGIDKKSEDKLKECLKIIKENNEKKE